MAECPSADEERLAVCPVLSVAERMSASVRSPEKSLKLSELWGLKQAFCPPPKENKQNGCLGGAFLVCFLVFRMASSALSDFIKYPVS